MISRLRVLPRKPSANPFQRTSSCINARNVPRPRMVMARAEADVSFSVYCHVPFGTAVVLAGDCEELGNWEIQSGVKMEWNEGDIWTTSVKLPPGSPIEFKYVMLEDGCERPPEWTHGANLQLELPADATSAEVKSVTGLVTHHVVTSQVVTLAGSNGTGPVAIEEVPSQTMVEATSEKTSAESEPQAELEPADLMQGAAELDYSSEELKEVVTLQEVAMEPPSEPAAEPTFAGNIVPGTPAMSTSEAADVSPEKKQ